MMAASRRIKVRDEEDDMISQAPAISKVFDRFSSEERILTLLSDGRTHTLEEVIQALPEVSWAQLFIAMDILSRRGDVELRRRGFTYTLRKATLPVDRSGGADAAPYPDHR